jgi:hypothetical protein
MGNTLTVTKLIGEGFLVQGQDEAGVHGQAVLYSPAWQEVLARSSHKLATALYNKEVEEFFSPILKAAKQADDTMSNPTNKWAKYTVTPASEGVKAVTVNLDPNGVLLYILQEEPTRLRWVKDETGTELIALA